MTASKRVAAVVKAGASFEDLLSAVENYAMAKVGTEQRHIKLAATFFTDERWREWLPGGDALANTPPLREKSRDRPIEALEPLSDDDKMAALHAEFAGVSR